MIKKSIYRKFFSYSAIFLFTAGPSNVNFPTTSLVTGVDSHLSYLFQSLSIATQRANIKGSLPNQKYHLHEIYKLCLGPVGLYNSTSIMWWQSLVPHYTLGNEFAYDVAVSHCFKVVSIALAPSVDEPFAWSWNMIIIITRNIGQAWTWVSWHSKKICNCKSRTP